MQRHGILDDDEEFAKTYSHIQLIKHTESPLYIEKKLPLTDAVILCIWI